jgi:hypothetical protein
LFYVALDGQLHAVPVRAAPNGSSLQAGSPVALFQTNIGAVLEGGSSQAYVVARDGERFLVITAGEAPRRSPITMMLNWRGRQN